MDVSITIQTQMPAGVSVAYRGGTVPHGYLLEDGSLVSKLAFPRLFDAIGYLYGGSGDDFRLPDSRGKGDIGSGQGVGLTNRVLGATGGAETHKLLETEMPSHTHIQNAHNHGVTDPGHTHDVHYGGTIDGGSQTGFSSGTLGSVNRTNSMSNPTSPKTTGISVNNQTATNQNTGGNQAHNNMQPYLVATKMVKY